VHVKDPPSLLKRYGTSLADGVSRKGLSSCKSIQSDPDHSWPGIFRNSKKSDEVTMEEYSLVPETPLFSFVKQTVA
jgi:hypothetical protein